MPSTPNPKRPLESEDPDVVQAAIDALAMEGDEREIEMYRRELEKRLVELEKAPVRWVPGTVARRLTGGSSPEALAQDLPRL